MDIDVRLHRVAGQESGLAAATVLKDLTSCDLVIDATANPQVFLRLAAVARVSRCPMCWGEVFAGGFGGIVARARPDLDPHPVAVRAAILRHLDTLPPAPFQRAGLQRPSSRARNCLRWRGYGDSRRVDANCPRSCPKERPKCLPIFRVPDWPTEGVDLFATV